MFYRRKVILALLQVLDRQVDKISLQKLLFLFTHRQAKAEYDFIPFKFGCFSFSANADLASMAKKGMLSESASDFASNEPANFLKTLKPADRDLMIEIKSLYGNRSADELIKHTYINFPYWAINSIKAKDILSKEQYEIVLKSKPKVDKTILFTIGYQGISLEEYLNRLIKNDIRVLVDVRNNPLSMKYGFSKSKLQHFCSSLAIEYVHFPEVGIQSEQRQELKTQKDYDSLFDIYCLNNLTKTVSSQKRILQLLEEKQRIALTCFEANICQCHRKHLAEAIQNLPNFTYEVKHI